jgi:hypothetical protein
MKVAMFTREDRIRPHFAGTAHGPPDQVNGTGAAGTVDGRYTRLPYKAK